ncbi:hypothetical protein ACILPE_07780 [Capnocytophaga canimorsus]|uniref:CdiA C-terminal domain-containing protein n=1 Tax=Capnocytophaga canimorsus TaxID=28188 RepID=UPI0037D84512
MLFETENGGKVLEHLLLQKGKDYDSILTSAIEFAKQGKTAEILPVINQKELKEYRKSVFLDYDLNKNPDLRVDGVYHDIKEVSNLKTFVRNANRAYEQGAIAILQNDDLDNFNDIQKRVKDIFKNGEYRYDIVFVLNKGKLYKFNRD